ncbi:MAG TPA: DNA-3-methyladenine glycosylase 2 family protein [Halococcus sp.]|nr:DNA-3-methyladenine glycosylase 2 family protein [Halococcus sp.]
MPDAHDHLRDDPKIGPLIEEYGERELEPADDPYERLVISIVNQLISTEAARTVKNRLFEAFEITPETILTADEDKLRDVGLSQQKVSAMKDAAAWWCEENITRERFAELSNEEVITDLTAISGIGDWTGKMFLMFSLGREDVFPVEDLAVRRGMEMLYDDPSRAEMREHAVEWKPYRSVATLYVWQIYVDENSSVEEIIA